jgi:hypothetical protein
MSLIPQISPRFEALIELTRDSFLLEERLRPITAEMNSYPLRVNVKTWQRNLQAAEEAAGFTTEYCRQLANDDNLRPNSSADCARALKADKTDKDSLCELANQGSLLADSIINARSAISCWSQLKAWKPYAEFGSVQCY